jgi:hypothetical protein
MEHRDMWRVAVPYHWNDGTKIDRQHHNAWDAKVCELTNGLMLRGLAKGKWGPKKEKIILVDVACDEITALRIREITKEHYKQEAVLIYKHAGPAFVG